MMETRHIGRPVTRNEDPRLLTGRALFVDDVELAGMLHVAFLRSPHAHAEILSIDTAAAAARPGVVAVITAEDLGDYWKPGPLLVPPPPIAGMTFRQRCQVPLARGVVRHVGEPVAMIVADSRYLAEDAVGDILVDYATLPVLGDLEAAVAPGAPRVHHDLPDNIAAEVVQRKGDYASARARAAHIVRRRYWYDHGASMAMETRGIVAEWDGKADRLTVWDTTQAPVVIRNGLAAMLGLSERQVRVIAPFIGGGFGPKMMMFYPEEVLVPWIAMRLERPVKWIEDRLEHFFATTHERGQLHEAEIALDAEGHILGVRDEFLMDTGAYNPYGLTVPLNSQCTLLNCYDIRHYESRFRAVYTNRTLVTPYRGAGRQHGVFVMERLLDAAAREIGLDRVEIRRRNLIPAHAFPYRNEIIYQDFTPLTYDSGNYGPILDKGAGRHRLRRLPGREGGGRASTGGASGRRRGLLSSKAPRIGPYEARAVRCADQREGHARDRDRHAGQGQLHLPSRKVVAEQLGGVGPRRGCDDGRHRPSSTGASHLRQPRRVVAGSATHGAATARPRKILKPASEHFECAEKPWCWRTARSPTPASRTPRHARRAGRGWRTRCAARSSPAPSRAWKPPAISARRWARRPPACTPWSSRWTPRRCARPSCATSWCMTAARC
jgi:hypothetical protein